MCGLILVYVDRMLNFIAFGVRLIAQPLNYSGIIAGLTSDVFGLRKPCRAASLPSSLRPTRSSQSARPNLTSLVSPRPSSRARTKIVPDPTRAVVTVVSGSSPNVYKTSLFLYLDPLTYLFATVQLQPEGPNTPNQNSRCYINRWNPSPVPSIHLILPPPSPMFLGSLSRRQPNPPRDPFPTNHCSPPTPPCLDPDHKRGAPPLFSS